MKLFQHLPLSPWLYQHWERQRQMLHRLHPDLRQSHCLIRHYHYYLGLEKLKECFLFLQKKNLALHRREVRRRRPSRHLIH